MTDPLITVEELESELVFAPPVLLDVRWSLAGGPDYDGYLSGHLPGAAFVDLDQDLAGPPGDGGRHPLPDTEVFEAAMRRCGVRGDRAVVAYDDGDSQAAARAWWLLGYFGHDDVRVLDGGLRAWMAAGLPVHPEEVALPPGDFDAQPGNRALLDADGAARVADEGVLFDVRTLPRYLGREEPVDPVAGHIPGARSAPGEGNRRNDGRLLPPEVLRARYNQLGVGDGGPVGAYCGSGVTAAQTVLALEHIGIEAALYAGSWSDWITDPDRPVAT